MRARRGFTLIELVLAIGLLSILFLALVRLLDTSLTIWGRTEASRELFEVGGAVMDLFDDDLQSLETGPRGDVVGDWVRFDIDENGIAGLLWPRLRFVRQASAAHLARLDPAGAAHPRERGRIEVCWALLPLRGADDDARQLGVLWRGERRLDDDERLSFLDEKFFGAGGRPVAGALEEVTGGVLWFEVWFAGQTTRLSDGWKLGGELFHASASWDAWNKERPDTEATDWNEAPAGMPRAKDLPLLPRRVRVAVELERPSELKRRTRTSSLVEVDATQFPVGDPTRLPGPGGMLLIDEEWMEVTSVGRRSVSVLRGRRGTRPVAHKSGTLVHHGSRVVREVPLAGIREDWDL